MERQRAFQMLYGLSFHETKDEGSLARAFRQSPHPEEQGPLGLPPEGFAWELVYGVWSRQKELDERIQKLSRHWRVARIARVELTILRMSMFEILHRPDIPPKVTINEAVELAKMFGDDQSRSFVNGILDAAAKAADHDESGVH